MLTHFLSSLPLVLAAENPLEHVVDHAQWAPHGIYLITNHMLVMIASAAAMLLIFPWITKRYRSGELVPTGTRNLLEAIMIYVREDVARPTLGHETDRFMPFLWTLFFFILFNNLIGLLPLDLLTGWFMKPLGLHPIFGTATANVWVTGTLAAVAFIVMQFNGIKANGLGTYLKHFFGGAPVYMAPIMIPVEIIGLFVKPFALAIRLFANMNAGHILLAVLLGFVVGAFEAFRGGIGSWGIAVPVVLGSVAIMCLELFVAFLQAYIFTFLTSLFIAQLVVHEHEHEAGEGGHHDEKHENFGSGDLTDGEQFPDAARQAGAHMAG